MKHFFDVGSNIGQTFADFLNPCSDYDGWTIWCFEPSPRHWPALMEVVKQQSKRYTIHLCPFGLRGSTSVMPFFMKDDPRGDSFEEFLASDHKTTNLDNGYMLHVPAIGIAVFIYNFIDLEDEITLKLDCEGSEYDILSSLLESPQSLKRITQIFVEWHRIIGLQNPQELTEEYALRGKYLQQWMF